MSERTERTNEPRRDFLQEIRNVIAEFRTKRGRKVGTFDDRLLLLTTIGARTERARTVPLVYSKDGDRYVVAASHGGSPKNPHWFHNLLANSTVWIEVGEEWIEAKASVARDSDRDRLLALHARRLPELLEYQSATSRTIPIVVLEPKHHF